MKSKHPMIDAVVSSAIIAMVAIPLCLVMAVSATWAAAEIVYRKVVK